MVNQPSYAGRHLACVLLAITSLVLPAARGAGSALAAAASKASAPLEALRRSFTVAGQPVPPEVFRDFGDGDMADAGSIRVTVDVAAAIGSNLYADPVKREGAWVIQTRVGSKGTEPMEQTGYRYIGVTANGLLIVVASYGGGGSGTFYTLHVLDASPAKGLTAEGERYARLDLTVLRSVPLGDRWNGEVAIHGNAVAITTRGGVPPGDDRPATTRTILAERP